VDQEVHATADREVGVTKHGRRYKTWAVLQGMGGVTENGQRYGAWAAGKNNGGCTEVRPPWTFRK